MPVAKMSGRGLGYTGGTVDKLEAIPGFCTEMDQEAFLETGKKNRSLCGRSVGQSGSGRQKALRVTGCHRYSRFHPAHCRIGYEQENCCRRRCHRAGCKMWQRRIHENSAGCFPPGPRDGCDWPGLRAAHGCGDHQYGRSAGALYRQWTGGSRGHRCFKGRGP